MSSVWGLCFGFLTCCAPATLAATLPTQPEPLIREVTMFTSTPEQTDATPCIAASGDICTPWLKGESICASNEFPIGTRIEFLTSKQSLPSHCVVKDRLNARYKTRIDLYNGFDSDCLNGINKGDSCPQYQAARTFGKQKVTIIIH